jgi:hypothetical protein
LYTGRLADPTGEAGLMEGGFEAEVAKGGVAARAAAVGLEAGGSVGIALGLAGADPEPQALTSIAATTTKPARRVRISTSHPSHWAELDASISIGFGPEVGHPRQANHGAGAIDCLKRACSQSPRCSRRASSISSIEAP